MASGPGDVQIRVVLAGEGRRRLILRGRAGSDGAGGLLAEPSDGTGDLRRDVDGDGDRLDDPAQLGAHCADGIAVVWPQARQLAAYRRRAERVRFGDDSLEGVGRHAETIRHAHAIDPGKLRQIRALATNGRDVRRIDLREVQYVGRHSVRLWCMR